MLGGGAGHIQDMINRMRQNKQLRNKGKSKKIKVQTKDKRSKALKYNIDKSKYSKVRKHIKARRRKEKRTTRLLILIMLIFIVGLSTWLIVNVSNR